MFLIYIIGIITWWVANCNGAALETIVADNVAEILIDHLLDHLTPPRIERIAQLLAQNDEYHKAKSIANSLNKFTMKAYRPIVQDNHDDIIFSPFTTYMSLSMLAYGTNEPTQAQLHALLEQGFNDRIDAQIKYSAIIDQLNVFKPSEFNLKYKIFYPDSCTPKAYLKNIEKIFRLELQGLDFQKSIWQARTTVDDWFANVIKSKARTGMTIQDVTKNLNEDTNLVVTNAVNFNRKFEKSLSVDTPRWFPDHEQTDVANQRQYYLADGIYSHGEIPEIHAKFIELPYENNGESVKMSLFIVMSTKDGSFSEIESNIEEITMEKLLKRSYSRIKAAFPSLAFSTVREITLPLERQLGVPEIFASDADFSRFLDCPGQHVTKFIQKNVVVMRTDGGLGPGENLEPWGSNSTDIEFIVDRSFIMIIAVTSPTPSILLIGQRQR